VEQAEANQLHPLVKPNLVRLIPFQSEHPLEVRAINGTFQHAGQTSLGLPPATFSCWLNVTPKWH